MAFSYTHSNNYGAKLLYQQQTKSHNKRLKEINSQNTKNYVSHPNLIRRNNSISKSQLREQQQHRRNIRSLLNFIERGKTMSDRLKDPHDFFAYPAYFFRETQKKSKNTNLRKKNNKKTQPNIDYSNREGMTINRKYGIDQSTVKQHLPILQQFTESELEQYTDSITRMIFNFNLNSRQRLEYLKSCVLKSALSYYPKQFPEIVDEIFEQIGQSLNFNTK